MTFTATLLFAMLIAVVANVAVHPDQFLAWVIAGIYLVWFLYANAPSDHEG